jgi:N4-gp56 family major capsid protein
MATNYINTVVNTGVLAGGTAVQLTNNVRAVYSKEIEFYAMPIMKFLQFAKIKTELGVQPGLTIQMMTYNNLSMGGALTEGVRMNTQALSSSMKSITVAEQGNAIAVSELTLRTSFTDVMADATTLLGRDMAITLDCQLRNVAVAGGTTGPYTTSTIFGRANVSSAKISAIGSIVANSNILSVATIKDAVEILATNNAPKFQASFYVCFAHPHQSRTLRDDPAWIEASKYGAVDQLFTGEIGRIEDVRFIETTLMPNGAAATSDPGYNAAFAGAGTNEANVYQAVIFGEDYYGYAVGLPVELRDNGVIDFGREHQLGWYAIWGSSILHAERAVIIETA